MLRSNQKGRIPVFVNLRQSYSLTFPPILFFCMSVFLGKEDLECETYVVLNIVFIFFFSFSFFFFFFLILFYFLFFT